MKPRSKAQQRELDLEAKSRMITEIDGHKLCEHCGGYVDGHTSTAGDGFKIGPCTCEKGETGVPFGAERSKLRGLNPSPHTPSNDKEGDPMPEQEAIDGRQLPTDESTALSLFAPLETPRNQLMQRLSELRNAPRMTRMQKRTLVADVNEWDKAAQQYLKVANDSEAAKHINNIFRAHRFLTGVWKKIIDPVNDGRRWASGVFAQWDAEEKARLADERRQREEAARKEQERQRVEEAAHLEAQGHKEEAIAHLESPLPPVALPDPKVQPTKPAGVSVMEFFNLERIVDPKALAGYLVEHPEDLFALFEPKMAEWKRRATAAKGQWQVPGVTFVKTTQTRNRG